MKKVGLLVVLGVAVSFALPASAEAVIVKKEDIMVDTARGPRSVLPMGPACAMVATCIAT